MIKRRSKKVFSPDNFLIFGTVIAYFDITFGAASITIQLLFLSDLDAVLILNAVMVLFAGGLLLLVLPEVKRQLRTAEKVKLVEKRADSHLKDMEDQLNKVSEMFGGAPFPGMVRPPAGWPQSAHAFYAVATVAAATPALVSAFRHDTGFDLNHFSSDIHFVFGMEAQPVSHDQALIIAWYDWVTGKFFTAQ